MRVRTIVLGAALLGAVSACQWLDRPREDEEKKALRRRVAELETKLRNCAASVPSIAEPRAAASAVTRSPSTEPQLPATATSAALPRNTTPPLGKASAQEPPPGMLPQPRPPAPKTHTVIELPDLPKHVGETLRFRMKDGRSFVGTLRGVDNGTVRMERDMGLGTSLFQIQLEDVDQVLKRL